MNSRLKDILDKLISDIKKKREGTRNIFSWKPYQKKLEKLVEKNELSQKNYNQINRLMNKLNKKTNKNKYQNTNYKKKKEIKNIKNKVTKYKNYKSYKNMNLALNKLYKTIGLSEKCKKLVNKTFLNLTSQKVIVYSDMCSRQIIFDHLNHRVPIYFAGDLFNNELEENEYKKLINGNSISENNEELEKIEMKNKFLNYVVIGEMEVIEPKLNVNYHAVHAFGVNFESSFTVDYKKIWLGNNKFENYKKKVELLYRNIFKGVDRFNNMYKQGDYSIILPAIGMGAFLHWIGDTENKKKLITMNLNVLYDIIKNEEINKAKKVYLRFREEPSLIWNQIVAEKNNQIVNEKVNIEGNDLFEKEDVEESNQYFVNAWDTRSFIGNKLNQDPTIDGWFVAGYNFNKNLINNSYLHNKVIFNPEQALIITN